MRSRRLAGNYGFDSGLMCESQSAPGTCARRQSGMAALYSSSKAGGILLYCYFAFTKSLNLSASSCCDRRSKRPSRNRFWTQVNRRLFKREWTKLAHRV